MSPVGRVDRPIARTVLPNSCERPHGGTWCTEAKTNCNEASCSGTITQRHPRRCRIDELRGVDDVNDAPVSHVLDLMVSFFGCSLKSFRTGGRRSIDFTVIFPPDCIFCVLMNCAKVTPTLHVATSRGRGSGRGCAGLYRYRPRPSLEAVAIHHCTFCESLPPYTSHTSTFTGFLVSVSSPDHGSWG